MNDLCAIIIIHEAIHAAKCTGKSPHRQPSEVLLAVSVTLLLVFLSKATPQGLMSIRKSTTFITLSLIISHLIKIILQEVPHEESNAKR